MATPRKRIAFIHPDLGIGGAERLVVDAAVGLTNLDNDITIYTSHCDPTHCFEEVKQLNVKVYGDFLPTHIFRRFHILCAIMRQLYLVTKMIITGEISQYDYFIIDQLSICIPIISWFSNDDSRTLFYCHFPDQLLSKRSSMLKRIYRYPFDTIEEWSTGSSDTVVVNSKFTKTIYHATFRHLSNDPGVIYPCVETTSNSTDCDPEVDTQVSNFFKSSKYFLSINRFERAKNIDLAIRAFAKLKRLIPTKTRLVIAGGFDPRVQENVEYLHELTTLCDHLKLTNFTIRGKLIMMPPLTEVLFLPSIKSALKVSLIKQAQLLLYTPPREHFGIVPVESMLYRTPVLAVNFGGPLETVVNYLGGNLNVATGYVEPADFEKWAKVMVKYWNELEEVKARLGENGYLRVVNNFSRDKTSQEFMRYLVALSHVPKYYSMAISYAIAIVISIVAVLIYTLL